MNNPIARKVLVAAIIALTLGVVAGCVRAKPLRELAALPTNAQQPIGPTPSPTAQLALPVVGGVGESQESSDVLATATESPVVPTAEPTMAPPEPTAALPEATPTVAAPEATPTPSAEIAHKVRTGDTLLSIAIQYGTTKQAIMERNGLTNPDLIRVGQTLIIPVDSVPSDTPAPRTHRVQPGETLSTIAAKYGLTTAALARANGLTNPNLVYVGQRLIIPS